jgi:hypothetical protein
MQLGLEDFEQKLKDLGVDSVDGLAYVCDQDCIDYGMTTVQRRKFFHYAPAPKADPSETLPESLPEQADPSAWIAVCGNENCNLIFAECECECKREDNIYWWNRETNEVTDVGAAEPCPGETAMEAMEPAAAEAEHAAPAEEEQAEGADEAEDAEGTGWNAPEVDVSMNEVNGEDRDVPGDEEDQGDPEVSGDSKKTEHRVTHPVFRPKVPPPLSQQSPKNANTTLYECVLRIGLSNAFDDERAKILRILQVGETLECLEECKLNPKTRILRVKVKATSDGKIGWATVEGNLGTVFLVERQEGEAPNDTPTQDLRASAKRPHADDEDRAPKFRRVDATAHNSLENSRGGAKLAARPGSVVYTSDGYPIRPGEKDCEYYLQGVCSYGWMCKFNHPEKDDPKQFPAVAPLLCQGLNSSDAPFADAVEAATKLCSDFNLSDDLRKRLSKCFCWRPATRERDMAQLYHQLKGAREPASYLVALMKRMEDGTFMTKGKGKGNAGRFDHRGDDPSPGDQNSRSSSRSSHFSV